MTEAGQLMTEVAEASFFFVVAKLDRRRYKPGEAFLRLPQETRDVLRELRSDDICDVRWPPWR